MRTWRILQAIIAGAILVVFGLINFQQGVIWFVLLLLGAASIAIGVKLFMDGRAEQRRRAGPTPPPRS
jgi:hypothetical protein